MFVRKPMSFRAKSVSYNFAAPAGRYDDVRKPRDWDFRRVGQRP